MKYTLKKKFHPNQVEEIGHVFETNSHSPICLCYKVSHEEFILAPHEIALLIHAGFLEIKKECKCETPAYHNLTCKPEQKCTGAHCKCMDIGGQCPNMHSYHCKEHNPDAYEKGGKPTPPLSRCMEEKEECNCMAYINKAIRKGRAHYVCKNCGKDVSLMWAYYQQAIQNE